VSAEDDDRQGGLEDGSLDPDEVDLDDPAVVLDEGADDE
jgi:hypothetical protein